MSTTNKPAFRPATLVYGAVMTLLGLTALVVTYQLTDSVLWALGALFAVGPVSGVLLRTIGLRNPYPPVKPRQWGPPGPDDLDPRRLWHH